MLKDWLISYVTQIIRVISKKLTYSALQFHTPTVTLQPQPLQLPPTPPPRDPWIYPLPHAACVKISFLAPTV